MADTWEFINHEDIAPLLIGEWGGHMEGKNLKWMTLLRDYMLEHHISHTFWCLNTNSGDTAGLWVSIGYSLAAKTDTSNGSSITWEEDKYALLEKALWQTQQTGKYIGLDHQIPLGINGTGISLGEFYKSYANTEGSNLDGGTVGGKKTDPITIVTTPPDVTTTEPECVTTVSQPDDTSKPGESTEAPVAGGLFGDVDCDKNVNIADAVLLARFCAEDTDATVTTQGKANADVNGDKQIDTDDITKILSYLANLIKLDDLNPTRK